MGLTIRVPGAAFTGYTAVVPSFDVDFTSGSLADKASGLAPIFTRASAAWYCDVDGVLKQAAAGVPRIGYDPVTHEVLGVLIEDQHTNELRYSRDLSNGDWIRYSVGIVDAPLYAAPAGAGCQKVVPNTSNTFHAVQLDRAQAVSAGQVWMSEMWAKAGELTKLSFEAVAFASGGSALAEAKLTVDLATGEITPSESGPSGYLQAYGTIMDARGFWHIWARLAMPASSATLKPSFAVLNSAGQVTYAGDGASGVYFDNAQLGQGLCPSSRIVTSGAGVFRAADVLYYESDTVTNAAFSDLGGALVASVWPTVRKAGWQSVAALVDGVPTEETESTVALGIDGQLPTCDIKVNGVLQRRLQGAGGSFASGSIGAAYAGQGALYGAGASLAVGTIASLPTAANRLLVGTPASFPSDGGGRSAGHLGRISLYRLRVRDDVMSVITA